MSQQKWYYLNPSLQKVGPITSKVFKVLADNGSIQPDTTLITEDGSKVIPAGTVKGLFPEKASSTVPREEPIDLALTPMPTSQPSPATPQPPPPPPVLPVNQPMAAPAHQASPFDQMPDPFAQFPLTSMPATPMPQGGYQAGGYSAQPYPAASSSSNNLLIVLAGGLGIFLVMILFFFLMTKSPDKPAGQDVAENPPVAASDADAVKKPVKKAPVQDDWEYDDDLDDRPARPAKSAKAAEASDPDPWAVVDEKPDRVPEERKAPRRGGPLSTEDLIAEYEGSIALISGKSSSGSGFVVMPGVIATNSHVVNSEEIDDLEVIFPSQTDRKKGPFKAKLLYEDSDRDLAFLAIPSKEHVVLEVKKNYKFRRGQDVVAIGSPGRGDGKVLENAVSKGILSTQTEVDDQEYYQLSIAVNSGNSGGPVLDSEGSVLGVVTLKATKTEAMAYCIPPDHVLKAMETVRKADAEQVRKHREQHDMMVHVHRGFEKFALVLELSGPPAEQLARDGIEDFDKAIRKNPDCAEAYIGRAILKGALNNLQGMADDLGHAIRLTTDSEKKAKLTELQAEVRQELNNRRSIASQPTGVPRFIMMHQNGGFGGIRPPMVPRPRLPGMPGGSAPRELSPEESLLLGAAREARYQQIAQKDRWTFNGRPLYGTLVGYEDGVAIFQGKDAKETDVPIKRYANRFAPQDLEDIKFYALYHGIPLGNLRPR